MELFLTLKLYLHNTELFIIELFWNLTMSKQIYTYTKLNYLCLTKLNSLK